MSARRIIAYQLSLFGWPPLPRFAWRRMFWNWTFSDLPLPVDDAAERQRQMLTCESRSADGAA